VRFLVKSLLALALLGAALALAWMLLLPWFATRTLRRLTGLNIEVKVVSANPFTGHLVVKNLQAFNPSNYPARDFVELRELSADVELFSAFKDQLVVDSLDLNIAKLEVIRLHDGRSNLSECLAAIAGPPLPPGTTVSGRPRQYLVKRLHVELDQFILADYTGSKAEVRTFDLRINQTYLNISNPRQLIVPQLVRTLYSFGLYHDVEQLLPGDLGKVLADAVSGLSAVGSKARDSVQKTGDFLKGVWEKLDHSHNP
jgi:hypothetical protein